MRSGYGTYECVGVDEFIFVVLFGDKLDDSFILLGVAGIELLASI